MNTMIDGLGIDLVELTTIKTKLSDAFIKRILSQDELTYYKTITHEKRKLTYLAGRFAAKEAYTKAYNTFETTLNFKEVSILNDANGKPYIQSKYRPDDTLFLSITHTDNYAVATVILYKK